MRPAHALQPAEALIFHRRGYGGQPVEQPQWFASIRSVVSVVDPSQFAGHVTAGFNSLFWFVSRIKNLPFNLDKGGFGSNSDWPPQVQLVHLDGLRLSRAGFLFSSAQLALCAAWHSSLILPWATPGRSL